MLLKGTNMALSFKITNTTDNIFKNIFTSHAYEHSGIYSYKLPCLDCQKEYIGQTGKTRYKEHIRNIKFNKRDSGDVLHILKSTHQYGHTEEIKQKIDHAVC